MSVGPTSGAAEGPPRRRRLSRGRRALFTLAPLGALLLGGELVVRIGRGALLDTGDARASRRDLNDMENPAAYHPQLGYVPRPGGHPLATIDEATFRRNGPGPDAPGPPILAVGDSFTFGDQVGDADSWPAQLERRLGRRVLNGGVFGYGLDQTVLRAEQLLEGREVAALIVGFIADDIRRCEMSRRYGAWKPYFTVEEGRLALHNVPVPPPTSDAPAGLLARSHLADAVFYRLAPNWWGSGRDKIKVHHDGLAVARLLVERLHALARARGVPLLLVAQGQVEWKGLDQEPLLDHARSLGIAVLDLVTEETALFAKDPSLVARWYDGHMTAAGNAHAAERISEELVRAWPERFGASR